MLLLAGGAGHGSVVYRNMCSTIPATPQPSKAASTSPAPPQPPGKPPHLALGPVWVVLDLVAALDGQHQPADHLLGHADQVVVVGVRLQTECKNRKERQGGGRGKRVSSSFPL